MNKYHFKKWLVLICLSFFLIGCQYKQWNSSNASLQSWEYADLRSLDPIDASEPEQDLIALYSRIDNQSVQIRLDFLEMASVIGTDIYILFNTNPGGLSEFNSGSSESITTDINWDYLIKIPARGNVVVIDDQYISVLGMALLIVRDPSTESLMLSFNKSTLPISISSTTIQIIVTSAGNNHILDKSNSFSIDAPSPARVQIFFAFWNAFSANTPAQALRSWAGAHSGPMSSRHGLKYLLDSAFMTKTPIYVLDLITFDNLSALDYINALYIVKDLINQGILSSENLGEVTNWENDFYLLKNKINMSVNIIYSLSEIDYAQYNKNFHDCPLVPRQHTLSIDDMNSLLDCKKSLIAYAINHPTLPIIMGGDFSVSLFGDPNISLAVFRYVATHPWLQVLSNDSFSTVYHSSFFSNVVRQLPKELPESHTQFIDAETSSEIYNTIEEALSHSPDNIITNVARQVYQRLVQPFPTETRSLRNNYLGQIGYLVAAAEWVEHPNSNVSCSSDLDFDVHNECIMANNNIFAIVDPDGGYIPFVFAVDDNSIHQIIGPTWEFIVGLSDSSEWDIQRGLLSDPAQFLGAFADSYHDWNDYDVLNSDGKIILVSGNTSKRKELFLYENGLHVEIQNLTNLPSSYNIPIVVDPWVRYTPGWGDLYSRVKSTHSFYWGIKQGVGVEIKSTNLINSFAFNDTRAVMSYPEDPNFDYSRGHYLPFPMALTIVNATDGLSVDIIINP
jgi:hypothetical protein